MNKIKPAIIAAFFFIFSFSIFAGNPHIESVSMWPVNPGFGDAVQITVVYCGQLYQDHYLDVAISSLAARDNADVSGIGQIFVVSRAGIDVPTSQPALSPGGQIGYLAQTQPGAVTVDCATCGSGSDDGKRFTKVYNVHVPPAAYYPGCNVSNLYLHVGMKDNNIGAGEWQSLVACQTNPVAISWPIGTESKNFTMSKRVEGVLQATNDMVLYSVDYEYWNGRLLLTDSIPGGGNFTLVSWGPQSATGAIISGPAIGSTSGTFSWNLRDRTALPGRASGTVWMLLRMNNNVAAGTVFSNNASGAMTGVTGQTAGASIVVGQAAASITLNQSEANPSFGNNITYYLTYQVNGSNLVGYQPFDDIPLGLYGSLAGTGGPAIPGWDFVAGASTEGQWQVMDICATGDRIVRGDAANPSEYPMMLYNGLPATNKMCQGIIIADTMIEPNGYEGADSSIVIRSDGVSMGSSYSLILSTDDFIGTNSGGNIGFERCEGASCIWPLSTNAVTITNNKWWRVKVEVAPPASSQYSFRAKVWAKGDPEPGAWTLTWTDPAPPASFDCNNGQLWKPGFRELHGAAGDVSDYFNNFMVYEPRVAASTTVWDTVPAGITYVGQQGPHPYTGNASVARWNLGIIANEGGTFTWWGTVNTCLGITNEALVNGAAPMVSNKSNMVMAVPQGCGTFAPTMTFTPTVTATMATTYTVTRTVTPTNTQFPGGSSTFTPTFTPSFTTTTGGTSTITRTFTPVVAGWAECFASKWGSNGTGNGQFNGPEGIAATVGTVYVADSINNRIQIFDSAGVYLSEWGTGGAGNGQFNTPVGIAVDGFGDVYVCDTGNSRIQKFNAIGTYETQWPMPSAGTPAGIAVDAGSGNVFVTDSTNHVIQRFSNIGTPLAQWGGFGTGNGEFDIPFGITVDNTGNVYVIDLNNSRVQKFDNAGAYITQWGSNGSGMGQLNYPYFGIGIDAFGYVYVADTGNNRIQVFDSAGVYITQWGVTGIGDGQFNNPDGIAFDASGNLYVTEYGNDRVQIFSVCTVPTAVPTITVTRTSTMSLSQIPTPTFTITFTPTTVTTPNDFTIATVVTNPLPGDNGGRNQCLDPNGNILVVALEWDGTCTCYVTVIYRYLPDGRLDTSFGTGGRMVCPGPQVHYSWEDSMTIKCDSMGRIVVAGYSDTCGGTCADVIIYRFLQDGTPDNTFNGGQCWRTYNDLAGGNGNDYVYDFDFDENGKMVCTGKSWNGTEYDAIIFRCNSDGSPDTTFGPGGCRKVSKSCGRKIKCSAGKIYIIGESESTDLGCTGTCKSMCVWKYNDDGTPDATFTAPCYINTAIGHSNCRPKSIVITTGGKIVVIGTVDDGSGCTIICKKMVIMVYNPDGSPDTAFNGTGMLEDVSGTDGSYVLEIDGKIVVCYIRHNGTDTDCVVKRFNMDGTVDTTFDGDGEMVYDSGSDDECYSILRLTICRLIAAGHTYNVGTGYDMILWNIEDMCPPHTPTASYTPTFTRTMTRTFTPTVTVTYTPTFTTTFTPTSTVTFTITQPVTPGCVIPDTSFNGSGFVMSDFNSEHNMVFSIAKDSLGKYVLAGMSGLNPAVWRYLPDGSLDTTFNSTGYVMPAGLGGVAPVAQDDRFVKVMIDANGKILVIGWVENTEGKSDMVIARFNNNGSFDISFNGTGIVVNHTPGAYTIANGLALDTAGRILVAGSGDASSTIYRYNSNGTPDTTFNGTGRVVTAGRHSDSIAVDASGKILADMRTTLGDMSELWRFNSNGSIDGTFTQTQLWTGVFSGSGRVNRIIFDPAGKIILAGDIAWNGAIFRLNPNGNLDTSFNGTGITTEMFGYVPWMTFYDAIAGSDGKITAAGIGVNSSGQNAGMLVRFNTAGTADTYFNNTGSVILDAGSNGANFLSLLIEPSGRLVTAGAMYYSAATDTDLLLAAYVDNCVYPTNTPSPTSTFTRTATGTVTPTITATPSFTRTITATYTFTPTVTATVTVTPTQACGFVSTPVFSVEMIFNPESSDNDIFNITSNTVLVSAPYLTVHPHGQSPNKPALTFLSALIPAEAMKYRVLYPKQTGYGDVDFVEITYADPCGVTATAVAQFEKSVISQKDVQLFKNVINPDDGERCRIAFKIYGGDHITVKVYSRTGSLIKNLYDSDVSGTGWKDAFWDGTNAQGEKVTSGVYYVVVDSDFYTVREKIAVVR